MFILQSLSDISDLLLAFAFLLIKINNENTTKNNNTNKKLMNLKKKKKWKIHSVSNQSRIPKIYGTCML